MHSQPSLVERQCLHCSNSFLARRRARPGQGTYCSATCHDKHRNNRETILARFWAKVLKTDTCWVWQGTRERRYKYGHFAITENGITKTVGAHRFAWEIANGPIPDGLLVLHSCDNMGCVRPDHLYLGTEADNTADMRRRGRTCCGERSKAAKLTEADVREIRRRYRFRGATKALGRKFGVTASTIRRIGRGLAWQHVPLAGEGFTGGDGI